VRIEICGGIAAGKTTLANVFGVAGYQSIFEDFRSNPFWRAFYANPGAHAFETEITFLLQHYHQLKTGATKDLVIVSDFSLVLDIAYADVGLTASKRAAFDAVCSAAEHDLGNPDLLIHLTCAPSVELSRIRARARPEEDALDLSFLTRLSDSLAARVEERRISTNVLTIDSGETDFAHSAAGQDRVLRLTASAVESAL
jgi:deoxyadenosine/deoxycytidine kinase